MSINCTNDKRKDSNFIIIEDDDFSRKSNGYFVCLSKSWPSILHILYGSVKLQRGRHFMIKSRLAFIKTDCLK
jgi:hypothetical protein